jgi:hypothetical protein
MQAQFTGEIGPFLDTVQQRQVSVVVAGGLKYASAGFSGGQAQAEQQIQTQMLRAIHEAIAPRMENGQLAFKDLIEGNTGSLIPEIFARSGLAQMGIAIDKLVMHFGIDGRPPRPIQTPAAATPVAAPQQVNLRVGGFNVNASSGSGVDTDGLKNQLVAKAKSTLMWWAFGVGITLLVLVAVGGYGYYAYKHTPGASGASGAPPAAEHGAAKPPPAKKK